MILTAERGDGTVLIQIAEGKALDLAGGTALRLPVTPDLCWHLRPAADLWSVADAATENAATTAKRTASCSPAGASA